jgi:SAM-dependent methyltransferase
VTALPPPFLFSTSIPMTDLPFSAAADRNKQPILDALRRVLGERAHVLEIASGTGQHAEWFAAAMPGWTWQPTDADAHMLPALASRVAQAGLPNLRAPLLLDVTAPQWPSQGAAFGEQGFDAICCANMLHIAPPAACVGLMQGAARHLRTGGAMCSMFAPPAACVGLMQGAARHLRTGGVLVTYGPYFEDAAPAESNVAFDESLRARNPSWGIRRLKDVEAEARRAGLALTQRHEMPANNLLLVFGH